MDSGSAPQAAFDPGEPLLVAKVRAYAQALSAYRTGALDAASFRTLRIQAGIHLQRAPSDRYMVRVKIPYGVTCADQLRTLAAACRYGSPRLHLTTRQSVEFHDVPQERTIGLLADLAEAGLTTWNAGGNSIRNIVGCPLLGTCPHQCFDAIPTARSLTRDCLEYTPAQHLPRKLKVGVSGCSADCAAARLQDVGLVATGQGTDRGFRAFVGGGVGASPAVGVPLAAWVPEAEAAPLLQAVAQVFDRLGNRQNRHRARLKWLVSEMGMERFQAEVAKACGEQGVGGVVWSRLDEPEVAEAARPCSEAPAAAVDPRWARARLRSEGDGAWAVSLPWPAGEISPDEARTVADWSEEFGSGSLSITASQEVVIRGVSSSRVEGLHSAIRVAMPDQLLAAVPVVSCPGAPYCNLAITRSKDLALQLADALAAEARRADLPGPEGLVVRVSGCPHSCSHARFAGIGLIGGSLKLGRHSVPVYTLLLGGSEDRAHPVAATVTVRVPARRVPEAVVRLVRAYAADRESGEPFTTWTVRRLIPELNLKKEAIRHD